MAGAPDRRSDASLALDHCPGFAVWTRRCVRSRKGKSSSMPIELKMPALSPTMEEGTLAKWLVKEGDAVKSGDILAEIETDKATMEFEAVDEGTIAKIVVPEGTDEVKVGAVIALIAGEGEDAGAAATAPAKAEAAAAPAKAEAPKAEAPAPEAPSTAPAPAPAPAPHPRRQRRAAATGSRRARSRGGSPSSRGSTLPLWPARAPAAASSRRISAARTAAQSPRRQRRRRPRLRRRRAQLRRHRTSRTRSVKLSNMRKTIARRLTESKQQVPHIYLDRRHPARRAAEAARRIEREPGGARRQAQRQRPDDQGARRRADRGAGMQRLDLRRPSAQISAAPTFRWRCRSRAG